MTAPWVFAEAYKYRRLRECFSVSEYWKDYDVFFRQKVKGRISTRFTYNSIIPTSVIPSRVPKRPYLSYLCGSPKSARRQLE